MVFWKQNTEKECYLWYFWADEQTQAYLVSAQAFIRPLLLEPKLRALTGISAPFRAAIYYGGGQDVHGVCVKFWGPWKPHSKGDLRLQDV